MLPIVASLAYPCHVVYASPTTVLALHLTISYLSDPLFFSDLVAAGAVLELSSLCNHLCMNTMYLAVGGARS